MKTVKRVELLVTLKIGNGRIIPYGTVFTDEHDPIPDFIQRRLSRGMAKQLPDIHVPSSEEKKATPKPKSVSAPTVEKKKVVLRKTP